MITCDVKVSFHDKYKGLYFCHFFNILISVLVCQITYPYHYYFCLIWTYRGEEGRDTLNKNSNNLTIYCFALVLSFCSNQTVLPVNLNIFLIFIWYLHLNRLWLVQKRKTPFWWNICEEKNAFFSCLLLLIIIIIFCLLVGRTDISINIFVKFSYKNKV